MLWYLGAWQIMGATAPTPPLKGSWFLEIVEGATSMPLIRTSSSPEFTALTGTRSLCLKPPHGQAPNTEGPPAAYWNVSELTKFVLSRLLFPPGNPHLPLAPAAPWLILAPPDVCTGAHVLPWELQGRNPSLQHSCLCVCHHTLPWLKPVPHHKNKETAGNLSHNMAFHNRELESRPHLKGTSQKSAYNVSGGKKKNVTLASGSLLSTRLIDLHPPK